MRGYETPDGKRMTDREFAFNYNQGIGQFAMPTTDSTGKTLDLHRRIRYICWRRKHG
jgi:hypothetical protein